MKVTIHKADEKAARVEIPAAEISISLEFPPTKTLEETDEVFATDAHFLEEALINTLPGGTYDRLLGLMLARKATHFRVTHGKFD